MNLHLSLDYIQFDANFTLNTATLCMLQYLLFLNLSILLQTFYRVYNIAVLDRKMKRKACETVGIERTNLGV